jgi:hypothetical protein
LLRTDKHSSVFLNFHDVMVEVLADDDVCRSQVRDDFSFFLADEKENVDITITISLTEPPYHQLPDKTYLRRETKDAKVSEANGKRYLDSFGDALVIWSFSDEKIEIFSADRKLLREKAYLMIMSRVGNQLDLRGLHRIHAMGVSFQGRAVICAMAMGGGKSTLTLGLMEHAGFYLLSDEVPLVSSKGDLRGFPIRLGVREDAKLDIPDRYISYFERTRYPSKRLIDASYFKGRVADNSLPGIFLVGQRIGAAKPAIHRASALKAFRVLLEMSIRARGVPELLEYVLRIQPRALFGQGFIYWSRFKACIALIRRSDCYTLELSNNPKANAEFVADFVAKKFVAAEPAETGYKLG